MSADAPIKPAMGPEAAATAKSTPGGVRLPLFKGVLPLERGRVAADIVAGVTLAAMNIPQAMGYTKIAGKVSPVFIRVPRMPLVTCLSHS